MKSFKPRKKKCRNTSCRREFLTERPMQSACGIPCAMAVARLQRERLAEKKAKEERAQTREAKQRIKRRCDYVSDAQAAFNAWVRERDHGQPCISCGRHHQGKYDAGHYRTVGGNPELRFEPLNCHRQCVPCNQHKSGNVVNYRLNLVLRIGADAVAWLEGPHEACKYTIDELVEITRLYRAKRRELIKRREQGPTHG